LVDMAAVVGEVKLTLWSHLQELYSAFDLYAAVGGGDFSHIQLNAYKQLLDDCALIESAADGLNAAAWDGLFIAVNSVNADGDAYNHKKGLNRQEFLSTLVRAAVMKYCRSSASSSRTFPEVSLAVEHLLAVDMLPRLRVANGELPIADTFRATHCYLESTSDELSRHLPSLRLVYSAVAEGSGLIGDELKSRTLIGYDEWQEMLDRLGWVDSQFGERDCSLCFILSRMRAVRESHLNGRAKVLQLSFEDFLEALVRVAVKKALPTDEEVRQSGLSDGGELILSLQIEPALWSAFLASHDAPLNQPAHRAIAHLLSLMMRQVGGRSRGADDLKLTAAEVSAFVKGRKGGKVSGATEETAAKAKTRR